MKIKYEAANMVNTWTMTELVASALLTTHRLAERLLRDLLDLGEGEAESQACEFEHMLSAEATSRSARCLAIRRPVLTAKRFRRATAARDCRRRSARW